MILTPNGLARKKPNGEAMKIPTPAIPTIVALLFAGWSGNAFGQAATDVDCDGCIDSSDIARNAIRSGHIKNGTIKNPDVALETIDGTRIRDGSIKSNDIADAAIDSSKLAPDVQETFSSLDQRVNELEDPSVAAAQVLTTIPLASEVRFLFAEYFGKFGFYPANNELALAHPATDIKNSFVSSVSIEKDVITATFGGNADLSIQGSTLIFSPNIAGDDVYFTCIPTGGVVAAFDQESCVFIDEPPEPLSSIREQVRSAVPLVGEVRWLIEDYYRYFDYWPTSNAQAGAESPGQINNAYVIDVEIGTGGVVTATYGHEADPSISGLAMYFTPTDYVGSISWSCVTFVPDRYEGLYGCDLPTVEPANPVYLVRQQIASGLALAKETQTAVEDFHKSNGFFPSSNSQAGAPPADEIVNNYVISVAIVASGAISITYGNDAYHEATYWPITLTPTDNGGSISWNCGDGPVDRFNVYECW